MLRAGLLGCDPAAPNPEPGEETSVHSTSPLCLVGRPFPYRDSSVSPLEKTVMDESLHFSFLCRCVFPIKEENDQFLPPPTGRL